MYPSTTASVYYAADHTARSRRCDLGSWEQLTAVHGRCLLELMLRVQGDLRKALAPIGVTPLQAGVLCYVREHSGVGLVVAAAAFRVEPPTLVDVVQDLVLKGWITNRRSVEDRRVVCLKLSRKGEAIVRRITPIVQGVEAMLSEQERGALRVSAGQCYDFQGSYAAPAASSALRLVNPGSDLGVERISRITHNIPLLRGN